MTQIKRLIFTLFISLFLIPVSYADMGPEIGVKKKSAPKKHRATPHRHHHVHHHHPDLCDFNCCEIKVDDQEIDRSFCLQMSGSLYADGLYYEYYREQALEYAIQLREEAARLCKACPESAVAYIDCARLIEGSWRHVDSIDFVPCDPCHEDEFLQHHHGYPAHHHHQWHHTHHHG